MGHSLLESEKGQSQVVNEQRTQVLGVDVTQGIPHGAAQTAAFYAGATSVLPSAQQRNRSVTLAPNQNDIDEGFSRELTKSRQLLSTLFNRLPQTGTSSVRTTIQAPILPDTATSDTNTPPVAHQDSAHSSSGNNIIRTIDNNNTEKSGRSSPGLGDDEALDTTQTKNSDNNLATDSSDKVQHADTQRNTATSETGSSSSGHDNSDHSEAESTKGKKKNERKQRATQSKSKQGSASKQSGTSKKTRATRKPSKPADDGKKRAGEKACQKGSKKQKK